MPLKLSFFKNDYLKIFFIFILSLALDYFLISNINNPPAWDQGYHLSNVFKMYNILKTNEVNIFQKLNKILDVTDSYRGPLTYLISAIFLAIFKNTYNLAYLSNQIFNLICIFSIYKLANFYKKKSLGIWAAIIFCFSTFIIKQRSDYLIDLSLTALTTLNLYFLTKWYLNNLASKTFSILSGFSLGLIFLTKPTGIILFLFPLLFIFIRLFRRNKSYFSTFNQLLLFIISFLILIFPWFSRHWLTIITSTINAWNWGVKYQDGLEFFSLESWLFYFKNLPSFFGILNFSIFSFIFLTEKIFGKNILKKDTKNELREIDNWFFIYFLNCYLVISLMSTKDLRFLLPLYPIFCIFLSKFINSGNYTFLKAKNKKIVLIMSICISLFLDSSNLMSKTYKEKSIYEWPHNSIINEIKNANPNLISVLAVIPDTKEINTFNLEAEAAKEGEYVAVRQVVSNKKNYKEDLKYFDWFLVKTGEQGIMTNESKKLLSKYLLDNNSFVTHKKWELPDQSKLILLRRRFLSTHINEVSCLGDKTQASITPRKNFISLEISGKGNEIKNANLLIDFIGNKSTQYMNISLANGLFHKNFNENLCYKISQELSSDFNEEDLSAKHIKARIIDNYGYIKPLRVIKSDVINLKESYENSDIKINNKISKVRLLGNYLREGKFDNLFNLVGIINQSDPKQIYLKEAEKIFFQRYRDNKNINDLYSLFISQVLQKKAAQAEKTINLILKKDYNNGNAHIAKSIINVYLFDGKSARFSINEAKKYKKSQESKQILNIVESLSYILEMNFKSAYNVLNNI